MLRPGDILAGKYRIIELAGKGGMAKVWRAEDTNRRLGREWAVKEISKTTELYKVDEELALREIEIMKTLDHPALPRIVDVVEDDQTICVVMDYIRGPNLQVILEEYGTQKEEAVVAWMLEVCDILTYLHSKNPPIIYRDLKPSNLMINPDGHIKIVDFGIAREYRGGADTAALGSEAYTSPEHHTQHTDVRSDIYTVGSTAYALLTGKTQKMPPYYIQPIRKIDPSLSQGLEKIILKATNTDPDKRYQTAAEMANALESYQKLDDTYIEGLQKETSSYRRRLIAAICVAVIGAMITAAGFITEQSNYNALVSSTGGNTESTIDNLKKAIELKPSREEAYIALIEAYASDGKFNETESEEFFESYNSHVSVIPGDVSYDIGETYLRYYTGETDSSARAKLLTAEPFFRAAEKDGTHKEIASNYLFLTECYKTYVMSDGSLLTGAGTKEDYEQMLRACTESIESASNDKMRLLMSEATIGLINSQCGEMKKAGVERTDIEKVLDLASQDAELTASAEEVMETLGRIYSPKREGAEPKEVEADG